MRILLWHVHGSWTTAFVQGVHRYFVPVLPDRGPNGLGRARTWDWPASAEEVPVDDLRRLDVDVVIVQRPIELDCLVPAWLGREPGTEVPTVYLEHDARRGDAERTRHPAADRAGVRIVHVTWFNRLMWDTGASPVRVIEHVDLYQRLMQAPENLDYVIPPGQAALRREGRRATVLTYLSMVHTVLEAAETLDADIDVIDLRWLDKASFDWETVAASVRKTNNVVIVEQGAQGTSYGAWLADEIQRRLFDWLDQPVQRVMGGEASPSISKVLERAAAAGPEEVTEALQSLLRHAA